MSDEYDRSVGGFRWRVPGCLKVSEDYDYSVGGILMVL